MNIKLFIYNYIIFHENEHQIYSKNILVFFC